MQARHQRCASGTLPARHGGVTESRPTNTRLQRFRLVVELERLLDAPATYLAFVFAAALIVELVLTAEGRRIPTILGWLQVVIWAFFIVHFALGVVIAPNRVLYIRRHWLTALSLLVPFLRVIRIFRVFAVLRTATFVRAIGSANRTSRVLRRTLGWTAAGYAAGLTVTVALFGSALLLLFEADAPRSAFPTYAEALWWSVGTLTTVGSAAEPVTLGGRIVAAFMMLAGLVLLGYIAGLLGAVLFGRRQSEEAGARRR